MKKFTNVFLFAALALASCNKVGPEVVIPDDQKERISFSMSDEGGTLPTKSETKAAFGATTDIVMLFRSNKDGGTTSVRANKTMAYTAVHTDMDDHSDVKFISDRVRYWDDAFGRSAHLSIYAIAVNQKQSQVNNSKTLDKCIDGPDIATTWSETTDATAITTSWKVATDQTSETLANEDLVYSNNIQPSGKYGVTWYDWENSTWAPSEHSGTDNVHGNGCMIFRVKPADPADPTGPGYFDKGHLIFNHALSRVSVTLKEGTGFDGVTNTDSDFKFDSGNITLLSMYTNGGLNMKTGVWDTKNTANITSMSPATVKAHANNTFTAQMLPDYQFVDGSNTNVMKFTIDANTYYITQDMLYDALYETEDNRISDYGYKVEAGVGRFEMQQGKHYKFTLTVNKKQIEAITATLKDWDDVNAEFEQDNTHITISTSRTGSEHNDELNLFKMEQDLGQIYTDDSYFTSAQGFANIRGDYKSSGVADLQEMKNNDDSSYNPKEWYANGWYYKDNRTAYHLRTLNNLAADEGGATDAKDDNVSNVDGKSKFNMNNGAQATQDYHWGAPMKTTPSLEYSITEGYSSSIHAGFVAPKNGTLNPINITELHMMSNINIILKTTTTSNKINLRTGDGSGDPYKYATVKLTKLYSKADVDMGSGLVTPNTVADAQEINRPTTYFKQNVDPAGDDITTTQAFTWSVVPQELVRDASNKVGITITTPDDNEYYVVADLSIIVPTSVGSQAGQMHNTTDPIIRWYPNHSYTYTFTLTKKGIEAITCTLADWVTVEGTDTPVDLED